MSQKRPIPISVLREETVANYPYWATRELLMNAIMHRDYETNAPIQFYEYDDRIDKIPAVYMEKSVRRIFRM